MIDNHLALYGRIVVPLIATAGAYVFWHHVVKAADDLSRQRRLLLVAYVSSRASIWLILTVYLQQFIGSSDPRLYYIPQLEHFLRGAVPIRDFYYPYAPSLMPLMLPFYVLAGRSLAGISLFAITAEALALLCFVKSTSLLQARGEMSQSWIVSALAIYALNPATLYWTVFQGYHSIMQTTYSMAAMYALLSNRVTLGYIAGLYSLAGAKLLAVLDWPGLLLVRRPQFKKLAWGIAPTLITYVAFQLVTGDILFPVRYHIGYASEGNVWYLASLAGDLGAFYSTFPGNCLPALSFGLVVLAGYGAWLNHFRHGRTTFSFQAAMGMTTFTMAVFFLFSLYTGSYYVPMLMLPACVVVTSPAVAGRSGILLLLAIVYFGFVGDAVWTALGQPTSLHGLSWTGSFAQRLMMSFWIAGIVVRIGCFGRLAQLGWRLAIAKSPEPHTVVALTSRSFRDQAMTAAHS